MSRIAWITLSSAALAVAVAVAVAAILVGRSGTETEPSTPDTTGAQYFSLPLALKPSTLALAKHDGNLLVGFAAQSGGPVEVAALRAETPLSGDDLTILLDGQEVDARPCGKGCSRFAAGVLAGSPARLSVRAGSSSVAFDLPASLPPDGDRLLARAQRVMESLRTFRFVEYLSSGREGTVAKFDVQAPDRLRFSTKRGFRSVIIGKAQWANESGRWDRRPFPGLNVAKVLMWHEVKHARIVGRGRAGTTELAAFGLQPVPAWFRVSVAPTGRVTEAEMLSPSHFMFHRYNDFNGRFAIKAPK